MDPIVPPDDPPPRGGRLPLAPDGEAPATRRARRWPWVSGVVVGLLALTLIGSIFLPTPYYRQAPGSVRATEALIEVQGAETFPDDAGEIGYTTISLGPATAFELVTGWLDPDVDIKSKEEAFPDVDPGEARELNLVAMDVSKDVAAVVALEAIGYDVTFEGEGAQVVEVVPDGPVAGAGVEVGEVVVAVGDRPVELAEDVADALEGLAPGDVVELTLTEPVPPDEAHAGTTDTEVPAPEPAPAERSVSVTLGERPDDPEAPFLGLATTTYGLTYELPVDVTIDSEQVGGPSAGLAFSLGIIDLLTPGDLTGGRRIATTGTMNLAGEVGAIGGVEQKAAAVRDAGVEVFLVPTANYEAALSAAGDVQVVPVATLDEALTALADLGGDTAAVERAAGGADG